MESLVTIEEVEGVDIVTLRGDIDAFTAPVIRPGLMRLIEEGSASTVIVDLGAVTFLDSTALGVLVGALRRVRERDGRLRIVQPRGSAARIFALTGLDRVFDLYQGRDAALSAENG